VTDQLIDRRDLPVFIHSDVDDLPLTPNAFRLYCHLARRAGNGTAWPSYQSMGDTCFKGLSESADYRRRLALENMKELVSAGLVAKEERTDGAGRNLTNVYYLTPRSAWTIGVSNNTPPCTTIREMGVSNNTLGVVSNNTLKGTPSEGSPITDVVVVVEEHATTAEIFQMWSDQTKGTFTSISSDILGGMIDSYGADAVKQAIIDAEKQGKRSLGYVQGILRNRLAGTEPQKPAQQPARTPQYNKPMSKVDASMAAVDNVFAMMKEQGITWE
jgi:DnaD/phage-associated family protein